MISNEVITYNPLYRPIKDGKEFFHLIKEGDCKRTTMPNGNTHVTVNLMVDWTKKHYKQAEKVAVKLRGTTVKETVDNIYGFLYNHIQYNADAELQQLRSPICSWAQRREGIDCKSFSIFASAILLNLGIPHYIREVRQPGSTPDQFTHVYIIVPKKGKNISPGNYYVIDATKHQNTEVIYLEAKDTFMSLPHVGLNGAHTVNRAARRKGLRLPQTAERGFNDFLLYLQRKGVPASTVKAVHQEVYKYLAMGIDPVMDIVDEGVVVQRKLFPFYNQSQGLGFAFLPIAGSVLSQTGTGGGTATGGAPLPGTAGTIASAASIVLESSFFKDTVGRIFANGFDITCWGSSYSPAEAKEHVTVDMPFILRYSGLEQAINSENLWKFMNFVEAYRRDAQWGQNGKYAKCTRKGHELREQSVTELENRILSDIRQNYELIQGPARKGGVLISGGLPGYANGRTFDYRLDYSVPTYTLRLKQGSTGGGISTGGGTVTQNPTNTGGGVVTTPFNPTNGNGNNTPPPQQAGMGVLGWVLGAGAVSALAYNYFKKSSSKN